MGGGESLSAGLNHPDKFAWVGGFSSAVMLAGSDVSKAFPAVDAKINSQLQLLWIACGTEDQLIKPNRQFEDWLTSKGVRFTRIETPGAHTWMVWRRNLTEFAPLLFQSKAKWTRQ
jgi:enterochelin esterase family protein